MPRCACCPLCSVTRAIDRALSNCAILAVAVGSSSGLTASFVRIVSARPGSNSHANADRRSRPPRRRRLLPLRPAIALGRRLRGGARRRWPQHQRLGERVRTLRKGAPQPAGDVQCVSDSGKYSDCLRWGECCGCSGGGRPPVSGRALCHERAADRRRRVPCAYIAGAQPIAVVIRRAHLPAATRTPRSAWIAPRHLRCKHLSAAACISAVRAARSRGVPRPRCPRRSIVRAGAPCSLTPGLSASSLPILGHGEKNRRIGKMTQRLRS